MGNAAENERERKGHKLMFNDSGSDSIAVPLLILSILSRNKYLKKKKRHDHIISIINKCKTVLYRMELETYIQE